MQISKATVQDAEEILMLQRLAFHSEAVLHNSFNIPPLQQSLSSLQEDFSDYSFYKAILDNILVGSVKVKLLENNILWIGRLVVHPDYQGQGIGKKIMTYIESMYPEKSGCELFTAEKSVKTISFYQRLGYKLVDTFSDPGHKDITLVKMKKE